MGMIVAVVATAAAGLSIVLAERRVRLVILAVQYVCVGLLVAAALPPAVAAAKSLAGLTATTILWTAVLLPSGGAAPHSRLQPERLHPMHWVAVGLVGAATLATGSQSWMGGTGITSEAALAAATLMGLGLLHIGVAQGALRVGIGLMTTLSGFEIAYSFVEPSLAVTALLGAVHLGIALVVSYLVRVLPLEDDRAREGSE